MENIQAERKAARCLEDIIRSFRPGRESVLDLVADQAEDGTPRTRIELAEKMQPPLTPVRAESKPRAHILHTVEGFAAYLSEYRTAKTVALADVEEQVVQAVLDETATIGREVISLRPIVHPRLKPWVDIFGELMSLGDFVSFIQKNRTSIAKRDGRELVMTLSQVKVSRKIELNAGANGLGVNGVICETEVKGVVQAQPVDIPEELTLETPIYVGTQKQELSVDLTLSVNSDHRVMITATSSDLLDKRLVAFEEILDKLRKIENLIVGHGSLQYGDWAYVR